MFDVVIKDAEIFDGSGAKPGTGMSTCRHCNGHGKVRAAQGFFTMRFVVQWIASERARKSVIPVAFWFFSIGGGVLLLVYALYRRDPVFIAGQALGLVVYFRNLYFIIVNGRQASAG